MRFGSVIVLVCLLAAPQAFGQAGQQERVPLAEEVFKNVQILRGIPVDEFMDTMGFFSAATGMNCTECHTGDADSSWANYAADAPMKNVSRRMMRMVTAINRDHFGGRRGITCFSCHAGTQRPKIDPSLAVQYGEPVDDPNYFVPLGQEPAAPILDKYIQALGGTAALARITSFTAKGTYMGYDTFQTEVPLDIYAQAPNRLATVVHEVGAARADSLKVYDGRAAWLVSQDRPIPLMPLTGGNLEGAKLDAMLSFPAQIKTAFAQWRTDTTFIDDREVRVVQGTNPGQLPVKFYFDDETGLLARVVRYAETVIGRVPTQIDYSDYREVAGVKMPFKWTVTWTDNRTFIELSEVQPNVAIDPAKFVRPAR
jgi:outer membrane lipoprotein-sorting protein